MGEKREGVRNEIRPRPLACARCLILALLPSMDCRGRRLVRIRIFRIIGFSGFYQPVSDWQALIRILIGGIFRCGEKRKPGETKS